MQAAELEGTRGDARTRQFHSIYRREFEFVWAAARRFGVPPAAVDDAVQDVFLTAYRRLDHLRYEVSPRAWLYGVTRRVAFRYRRGASRLARRVEAFAVVAPAPIEAPHQRHEAAQLLARLLAQLGEGTRAVWEMTELLGMSGPEIAAELELPLNTVYSRLRLARAQLHELAGDPQRLAVCVAAHREGEAPPPGAEPRAWALLVPMFGKGGALVAAAGAGWASTRAAVAATLIAAGGAVVGLTVTRTEEDRGAARAEVRAAGGEGVAHEVSPGTGEAGARASSATGPGTEESGAVGADPLSSGTGDRGAGRAASEAGARAGDAGRMSSGTGEGAPAGTGVGAAGGTDESGAVAASSRAGAASGSSSGTGARRRPSGSDSGDMSSGAASDRLAEEVALLDRARAELAAGAPEAALARLDAHAREFPGGSLADARAAARAEALCGLGRVDEARAAARALLEQHPGSPLARRFEQFVCPR